jgi:hypothetical protein
MSETISSISLEEKVFCPNNIYCGNELYYQDYLDCQNGVCLDCDMNFGNWCGGESKLNFSESDCPICLNQNVNCIDFPSCKRHKICVSCFQKIIDPKFPENEPILSDEQYDLIESLDEENYPDWYREFKIVLDIFREREKNFYNTQYNNRENRKRCPMCREGFNQ